MEIMPNQKKMSSKKPGKKKKSGKPGKGKVKRNASEVRRRRTVRKNIKNFSRELKKDLEARQKEAKERSRKIRQRKEKEEDEKLKVERVEVRKKYREGRKRTSKRSSSAKLKRTSSISLPGISQMSLGSVSSRRSHTSLGPVKPKEVDESGLFSQNNKQLRQKIADKFQNNDGLIKSPSQWEEMNDGEEPTKQKVKRVHVELPATLIAKKSNTPASPSAWIKSQLDDDSEQSSGSSLPDHID